MAKTETLHIRIEPDVKKEVETTLNQLGLSTAEAINIFLRQIMLTGGLPFAVKIPQPNAVTLAAMKESNDIINGKMQSNPQSVDSFFKEMEL